MGSLIFKILSLKTITDNQVLEDKLSSLTWSMEGLVLYSLQLGLYIVKTFNVDDRKQIEESFYG